MSFGNINYNSMNPGRLIHYGSRNFNRNIFRPIINRQWEKPHGGLWTSPVNSEWGWKDWCEMENFRKCRKGNSFELELKPKVEVLIIDSHSDLLNCPLLDSYQYALSSHYINFEKVAQNYGAIWLTEKGLSESRWARDVSLYSWDCETVLILNPDCFNVVSKEILIPAGESLSA